MVDGVTVEWMGQETVFEKLRDDLDGLVPGAHPV